MSGTIRVMLHSAAEEHLAAAIAEAAVATWVRQGSTAHFVVFYDQSLGPNGPVLADAVLGRCEADYNSLEGWFGNISTGYPFHSASPLEATSGWFSLADLTIAS